jgi:hypothetical protein
MKRYHTNVVEMATMVSKFLAANKTLWQGNAAMQETVTEVDGNLGAITGIDVKQTAPVTGPAADKAAARVELEEEILVVANQIAALATKNKDATLEAQADLSLAKLDALSADDVVAAATRIGNLATANLAALAAYGILPADLTKLGGLATSFADIKTAPRTAVVNRKKETVQLPPVVSSLLSTLRRRLDRQLTVFKKTQPEFYAGYLAARVIVNRGNPAKKKTPPTPPPTP